MARSRFTVSAWVYIESFPQGAEDLAILGTESDQTGKTDKDLHLVIRDKKLYMGFYNNDTQGDTELVEHQWYFLTWKYDQENKQQSIFINGKNDGIKTGADPFSEERSVKIGRWRVSHESTSQHQHGNFNGTIDEVIIYDRALTEDEIKQLAGKLATPTAINSKFGKSRNPIQTDGVVNAAFIHGEKTYLFSDDLYYRYDQSEFDDNSEFYVAPGYPQLLKNNTDGLPKWNGVRAVFKKDDKVHLFSESLIQYAIFEPGSRLEIQNIKGIPLSSFWDR